MSDLNVQRDVRGHVVVKIDDSDDLLDIHRLRYQYAAILSPVQLRQYARWKIDIEKDIAGQLTAAIHKDLLAEEKSEIKTLIVHQPANFWEQFKKEWMPQWFIHRFPIKFVEEKHRYTAVTRRVCPHADVVLGDDPGPHIRFLLDRAQGDDLVAERLLRALSECGTQGFVGEVPHTIFRIIDRAAEADKKVTAQALEIEQLKAHIRSLEGERFRKSKRKTKKGIAA